MFLGIDLGGTKIETVVLSEGEDDTRGEILFRKRVATPATDYEATLRAIVGLVHEAESTFDVFDVIGLGTPGAISRKTGLMKNCNSTCLNGMPLVQDLEHLLNKKVVQANDANCFALSEAVDGAGQGSGTVFGVILGTGVGGGVVVNSTVLQGVNRIAGEWGHNPMPVAVLPESEVRQCYCGKTNCIETFLSGPGFAKTFTQWAKQKDLPVAQNLSALKIAELAEQGDVTALEVLDLYARQLVAALAGVINILDPEVVVLGGGMSNIQALYGSVQRYLADFVFSDSVLTRILPPVYGDSSGVRGAAWLAK